MLTVKRKTPKVLLGTLAIFCALFSLALGVKAQNTNILHNSSFENASQHWILPSGIAKLGNQARTGAHSLEFHNTDPAVYKYAVQKFPAHPGDLLNFGAWVKGEGVQSALADKGASLFVEVTDKNGHWMWGSYPAGFSGDFDWKEVKGQYKVPDNAAGFTIGLYMRRGTIGKAWFDDVYVNVQRAKPFEAILLYPNYRGLTPVNNTLPWQTQLKFFLPPDSGRSMLKNTLKNQVGQVLFEDTAELQPGYYEETITYNHSGHLPAGKYFWNFELAGRYPHAQQLKVNITREMPRVFIDDEGFAVKNNRRIFPLGTYLLGARTSDVTSLERIARAGFNTVVSYSYGDDWRKETNAATPLEFLNYAHEKNLHVIYSLKDMYDGHAGYPRSGKNASQVREEYVEQYKNHPSLLAWYINDEFNPDRVPQIKAAHSQVKALDPSHPTYQVLYQHNQLNDYFGATDVWGTDPYPIGGDSKQQIDLVTRMMKNTVKASRGVTGIWEVLQMHDIGTYGAKTPKVVPTLSEMRNMTYQALVNGAKGLLYYSYFDLDLPDHQRQPDAALLEKRWPHIQALLAEIQPLTDVILKNNLVTLEKTAPSPVQYRAWQDGDKLHLAVVSTENTDSRLQLNIPQMWNIPAQQISGITWQRVGNSLILNLSGQASGVIVMENKLADSTDVLKKKKAVVQKESLLSGITSFFALRSSPIH